MKKLAFLIAFMAATWCPDAWPANLPIPAQDHFPQNKLVNPGFENGKYGWTASGGATAAANATAKGEGTFGYEWNSNGAAQTLLSTAYTIEAQLKGKNGLAYCGFIVPSGAATHTISVNDGSNDIVTAQTITNSASQFVRMSLNFIYPTSGSVKIKITSVAADEPDIYIDGCYLGEALNIQQMSQASAYGTLSYAGTASCEWTVTQSTFAADFGADTDCSAPSVTGGAAAPATKVPHVLLNAAPPGTYVVYVQGGIAFNTGGFQAAMFDGSGNISQQSVNNNGDGNTLFLVGTATYTTPGDRVFKVRMAASSGATTFRDSSVLGELKYVILRYPLTTETAFRPEMVNWRVDANISGTNPDLGSSGVSAYTEITSAALTLTNNSGNGVLTAQIPCSTTNAPTGTTCAVGNESVGVSFTLPVAGDVLACASFTHQFDTTDSDLLETGFQIVETPANAQTISQEGKSRVISGDSAGSGGASAAPGISYPHRVCGTFTFSSAGQKVLRLFYEQDVTGGLDANIIKCDAGASEGQPDVHWEVYPINQAMPAPILVNSVVTNSGGSVKTIYADLNCDAASVITSQSGTTSDGVATVGNISTGVCAGTFASGTFSAAPICVANVKGSTLDRNARIDATSSTAFSLYCIVPSTGAAHTACDISVSCVGAK